MLALTTLPILVVGFLLHGIIKTYLFNNTNVVAIGLAVGGVAIVLIERWRPRPRCYELGALRWREALTVGLFQCLAVWPGTSRAAATILGGMLIGIERKTAAEYSFLAAVPAICAAVGYDLFKSRSILHTSDIPAFAVGFVVCLHRGSHRRQRLHPSPGFTYVKRALAGIALSSHWAFFSCSAQSKSKATMRQ